MTSDIVIPPGLKGDIVQIIVKLEDGELDDLTQYSTVVLNVFSADFTTNPIVDLDLTSSPNSVNNIGEANFDPAGVLTTPGKFWLIVKRTSSTTLVRPARKISLEVTQQE